MQNYRDGDDRFRESPPASKNESRRPAFARFEEVGDMHYYAAAYSSALEYFRSALRAVEQGGASVEQMAEDRARLHMRLADCHRKQGALSEALEELEIGSALLQDHDAPRQAVVKVRMAHIRGDQGRYDEALELAREAFAVLARTDLHAEVGSAQIVLGMCHQRLGALEKAEEFYQDTLATYRRIGDGRGQADALHNLAMLAKNACRWARALQLYDQAEQLYHANGATYPFCRLYLNKAILYRKMGRRFEAHANVEKGLHLARNLGDQARLAKFNLLRGQLLIDDGQFAEAERSLLEAKVLAERCGSARELALVDEFLGDLMAAQERYDEAELNYGLAEQKARQISPTNDVLAELLRRRSEVALARGDAEGGLRLAESGLRMVDRCGEDFERGPLERVVGASLRALGRSQEAFQSYERALAAFRRQRLHRQTAQLLSAMAELHVEIGGREQLLVARSRLNESLRLELEDRALTVDLQLQMARVELSLGNHDEALLVLFEVERMASEESEYEGKVEMLRDEIEAAMADHARDARSPYELLVDLPDRLSDEGVSHDQNLESVLRALTERLGARRGLVALRPESGRFHLAAVRGLNRMPARELAQHVLDLLVEEQVDQGPRVWTRVPLDERWSTVESAAVDGIDSAVAFPVAVEGCGLALFYVDVPVDAPEQLALDSESLAMASTYVDLAEPSLRALGHERGAPSFGVDGEDLEDLFPHVLTQSERMHEILQLCAKVAPSPYTVLFNGETGTGKGLLAKAIHELSPRRDQAFVSVNCAAIPETLLESELFGHMRGSFTGADRDREGLILSARGGTLFLDEVGKMSLPMQAKLLHFLDTKEVRPVGGTTSRPVDVRVLCASKRDLRTMVEHDEFLEDLYYRLLDFPIEVPPLRDRGDDVLLLAKHYIERVTTELGRPLPRMTRSFASRLRSYTWPGNVRELDKLVKRAVILAGSDDRLRESHLPIELCRGRALEDGEEFHSEQRPLKDQVAELERVVLQQSLDASGWNRAAVARQLKISYPTLLQKIRLYRLRPAS